MFNNFGLGLRQSGIIGTTIKVLQSIEQKDPVKEMAKAMSIRVMKDKEVFFIIRTFCNKYDLALNNVYIEPVVEEDSLSVKRWALYVNDAVAFEANGCQELLDDLSAKILCRDIAEIQKVVATLEACLKK